MTPQQEVELLRAAICVACANGEANEVEQRLIDRLADNVGVGDASMQAMMDRAKRDPDFYQQQFQILKSDPKDSIVSLVNVAMADGDVDDQEIRVLRGLAGQLNIPDDTFDELMQRVENLIAERKKG